ncbi:type II toxin-antitoxin system RelE/ParE family toxin [Gemmata sp. JC673]|uniref:Type II toxin-antitoxin system RelE/ParE family toxin n=1 Tax=Gemmata algarum TaxID=2975278 RepID=A0ABU5EYS5_9BACT|nr:type II toxin-antitoxin system RelE/ParE family toxin [Gemmata algarum]MDY3558836.1 type II toxin-antitoxin system RelE/ParE family toxin [Gemmata algarum]
MSFAVSPAASADVIATSAAYDRKPGRYGQEFENEVDVAFLRIAETPRTFPLVEDDVPGREVREFFIERFQQRVIYQVRGEDVLVVAVIHASRRPGAWHRSLPADPPSETT